MRSWVFNLFLIIAALIVMAAGPEIVPRLISQSMLLVSLLALLVGTPIALLVWFGRFSERRAEAAVAGLWQQALLEASDELADEGPEQNAAFGAARRAFQPGLALALLILVIQSFGLAACAHTSNPEWKDVEKGMLAADVVSLLGAPDHVQSNREVETWQYCRDFFGYFADQYAVIWIQNGRVANIQYYKNLRDGGCADFFRTVR